MDVPESSSRTALAVRATSNTVVRLHSTMLMVASLNVGPRTRNLSQVEDPLQEEGW